MMRPLNFYADLRLDRAGPRRKDAAWVAELLTLETTRIIPVQKTRNLLHEHEETPRPALFSPADLPPLDDWTPVVLGLDENGVAHVAVEWPDHVEFDHPEAPVTLVDLRSAGPRLAAGDAALLAYARAMQHWHQRHRYCGACGTLTEAAEGGHVRRCPNPFCKLTHFPRTDPVVIMLVVDGEDCLLGRQSGWPAGMYSALAGFVEPGETLEQAVAREVREESGIEIGEAHYQSSQPWPFPASLMLGFVAEAKSRTIRIDDELEDARWVSRAALKAGPTVSGVRVPPRFAIAGAMIEAWLAEG